MSGESYLGMRPGDLDGKPYAKYWDPHMGPMQAQVREALMHGPETPELGFPLCVANRLLEPGYLPMECGWTRLEDGQVFVAHQCRMPGVHGPMLDWWMGWHYMEPQRYKLSHPRCHVLKRADRMIGDDPHLPDREKWIGNTMHCLQYVGSDRVELEGRCYEASEFLDVSRFADVSLAICSVQRIAGTPISFGTFLHLVRETESGCELRSRAWLERLEIGGLPERGILDRLAGSRPVAEVTVPLESGRDLLVHYAMEFNHLAQFLPELYADYHQR